MASQPGDVFLYANAATEMLCLTPCSIICLLICLTIPRQDNASSMSRSPKSARHEMCFLTGISRTSYGSMLLASNSGKGITFSFFSFLSKRCFFASKSSCSSCSRSRYMIISSKVMLSKRSCHASCLSLFSFNTFPGSFFPSLHFGIM